MNSIDRKKDKQVNKKTNKGIKNEETKKDRMVGKTFNSK